ncbi:hypothetical protein BpHYR1_018613 [Brachionus plicatilis]|uniref:Uncharacterized protein n=1 Tax=Brachionus plicatilis TaxID=10195 RepID=A0A3M7SJD0_BRAPC|nr:hypothetical protein BpHYR1_018613 [Brachionus plicatilis]
MQQCLSSSIVSISLETQHEIINKQQSKRNYHFTRTSTSTISTILFSKAKVLELYKKNLCGTKKKDLNCPVTMTSINQCCFGLSKFKDIIM